jgi:hypothetical protein
MFGKYIIFVNTFFKWRIVQVNSLKVKWYNMFTPIIIIVEKLIFYIYNFNFINLNINVHIYIILIVMLNVWAFKRNYE